MRACSTVTLSVFPLHIAITQIRPHFLSALCRSTQLTTSINNVVFQRGFRPASCIVDVDWLKVWVQLVVRGRDEVYRDGQLNRVFAYCMDSNEHFRVALLGRGLVLVDRRPSWSDILFCRKWNSDAVSSHCSICTELHCRMYCCLIKTYILSVTLTTVPSSRVTVSVTFTVFGHFVLVH